MPRAHAILGTLSIDRNADAPLQRQLYGALRDAILERRLVSGALLPSTRTLARDLGIARNTVVAVFEQLAGEGYLEGRVGAGTRVAAIPPEALLHARPAGRVAEAGTAPGLSRRGVALGRTRRPDARPDRRAFQPGWPAVEAFPHAVWARLVARRTRQATRGNLGYAHAAGHPLLRESITAYLGAARGVTCAPEQVIVVTGAQAGLDIACQMLLDAGDAAWIEEPGYLGARGALLRAGARLVPVPVDAEGLDVEAGARACPDARLVYTTPSHQFPLGVTMSLSRRLVLLERAARMGAWILEDDYDSEYRYAGRPLAAMQGIDRGGRVVYVGTFSKTMLPALRVGYLVVPAGLAETFAAVIRLTGHTVPTAIQLALADFIAEGQLAAHVRRMRILYAARQERLVAAARRRLAGRLDVAPVEAGLQLAALLPPGADDVTISAAADAAGIVAPPLAMYHLGRRRRPGLLLGYAGVPEREIDAGVERLARVLDAHRRS